jgi:membrane-bound serine protease (ClpP class)
MENPTLVLISLLVAGTLMIGAEIFVPGAILGTMGGIALFAAVIVGFTISPEVGFYTLSGVFVLTVLTVIAWIRLFPRSTIGQKMTLNEDGKAFKSSDSRQSLMGAAGITASELRPAGFALINGKRIDVVAEGGIIDINQPVKVVKVEGNRVVVRKANG